VPDIPEEKDPADPPVKRYKNQWFVMPLGEWIAWRRKRRVHHIAYNFFKNPYSHADHQQRFSVFLAAMTATDSADAHAFARYLDELLHPTGDPRTAVYVNEGRKRAWLAAFLADTPEWDQRLRAWIEGMRMHGKS
jgi:hypothetical protein